MNRKSLVKTSSASVSTANNRRGFAKQSVGAVASALSVPSILPRLFAQNATEQIGVACIGVGGRGSRIGEQAASLERLVACCDVDQKNAQRFAEGQRSKGRECKTYYDYRELLDKESGVDAVVIGTPDHWHVKIAMEAMRAGKHVYCEKPLTLTIGEGQQIQQGVERYGKVFQVGTQQRSEFDLRFVKAVAIARSGRLGTNLKAISSVGKAASRATKQDKSFGPFPHAPVPEHLDFDFWLGPAPKVDYSPERVGWSFRWWFEYSGGQVTDWGVHHTDIAFWALAGTDGEAISAKGSGEFMGTTREQSLGLLTGTVPTDQIPNSWNVAHSFDVDIQLSTGNQIKLISGTNELLIFGENGRIRVNRGSLTGAPVEQIDADPKARADIEEKMAEVCGGELPRGHMQNFFDCIRRGTQPIANVREHIRAVNACHLANIALLTNRHVHFDPSRQRFPKDDEANRLISRTQRSEYAMES